MNVLHALHQLIGHVEPANPNAAIPRVRNIPNTRTLSPQLPARGQNLQPDPISGTNQLQGQIGGIQNSPFSPHVQMYDLHGLVDSYNQNAKNQQMLNNISNEIPTGQPGGYPAYHDLSGMQKGYTTGDNLRDSAGGIIGIPKNVFNIVRHPSRIF